VRGARQLLGVPKIKMDAAPAKGEGDPFQVRRPVLIGKRPLGVRGMEPEPVPPGEVPAQGEAPKGREIVVETETRAFSG
jgi:hypothetical protein